MMNSGKIINNNALAVLTQRAGPQVTAAIQKASLKTGVDFTYMMEKAAAESSFDAAAKAKTSSASGLYQFIESTWLQMVNRYGEKYGLENYADQISDSGKVTDPALRREILSLRNDPEIASLMAGEFAAENKRSMVRAGVPEEQIGSTELYLAHFLGAGAASEFIKAKNENPLTPAADLFPRAAKANHNVFYERNTQAARSLGEVYAFFDRKFIDNGNAVTPVKSGANAIAANDRSVKPAAQNIAANSMLRNPAAGINQIDPALFAMMNADMEIDRAGLLLGAGQDSSFASLLGNGQKTGSIRNLVADPVALMLMAKIDTKDNAQAEDRTANQRKTRLGEALSLLKR